MQKKHIKKNKKFSLALFLKIFFSSFFRPQSANSRLIIGNSVLIRRILVKILLHDDWLIQ